jgi:hypothetical protein
MTIFWNNHRNFSKANPLLGGLFVYIFSATEAAKNSIATLERDKETLEARFETEQDLKKRAKIKDEIKEIGKEIKRLKSLEPSKTPLALFNGLENNIKEIEGELDKEPDIANRQVLENRKIACLDALEARQRKIENHDQLTDALDQISNDDFIIKSLTNKDFDYINIEYLLSSNLEPFFDDKFRGQLIAAEQQMITSDFTKNALRPQRDQLAIDSDKEWFEYKKGIDEEVTKLEKEREELNLKLEEDFDINQKGQLKERIKWIDNIIPHFTKQAGRRSEWTHKSVLKKEKDLSGASLLEDVSPEVLDKMKKFMEEARFMRAEKIREYLEAEFEEVKKQFEQVKKNNTFSKSTIDGETLMIDGEPIERRGLQKDFDEFSLFLQYLANPDEIAILDKIERDPKIDIDQYQKNLKDPQILKTLASNLEEFKMRLSISKSEIKTIRADRGNIERTILSEFGRMDSVMKQFKPDEIQLLKERLEKDELKRLKAIDENNTKDAKTKYDERKDSSLLYQQKLRAIDEFITPDSDLKKHFKKYKNLLRGIKSLEPEELQMIRQELGILRPKLKMLENFSQSMEKALNPENNAAMKAHQSIIELESAADIEEIRHILNRNLGAEHLMLVGSAEFENKYRKYTPEGFMAFYQKEDEAGNILDWNIIIDESALADPKNVKELKRQLTHELLHLEFEKSEDVKREIREKFVSDTEWPKIRQAFIDKAESEGKKPPTGDEWADDDILSELYAMQNEIGNVWIPGSSHDAVLNNLLVGAGLASGFKDVTEKIKGYEKGIEKIRGMSGMTQGDAAATEEPTAEGVVGNYEEFKNTIDIQGNLIKELDTSEFKGFVPGIPAAISILQKMHKDISDLNERFRQELDNSILAAGIEAAIQQMKDGVKQVEKALAEASGKSPNLEINPFRKIWNNTSFLCMSDIVQVLIDIKEFVSRRHNRKKSDHAARLGMALFQKTDLGREAHARKQKAEMAEVQEWQSRYENLDAWQLEAEIKSMSKAIDPTKDQLKAVLRLLAQKGRLNWRNGFLWALLNKLQGSVHLKPNDQILMHNPPLMRQKLQEALGEIWDYDEFLTLESQNASGYSSAIQKHTPACDRTQDQLSDRLDQLLKMHREGEKVDPTEYESILVYAIDNGKSFAECVMFHLMIGIADGLLWQDRGLALDKFLNKWPATQWIYNQKPPLTRSDYLTISKKYFKDDYNAGSIRGDHGRQFKNFYWTQIQNDMMTIQRVRKSVSERGWDHDWTRTIACLGDANTAKRFFSGRSGQQEAKDTGIENAYAGVVQWLEENAVDPNKINFRYHFARMAGWIGMAEGVMDRVAYYRGGDDISTRSNESMEESKAREQSVTNHSDWKLRDNRKRARDFLDNLDPELFGILRSQKDVTGDAKKELGQKAKDYLMKKYPSKASEWQYIKDVDGIFERMDLVIKTIFDSFSDSELKAKIALMKVHN